MYVIINIKLYFVCNNKRYKKNPRVVEWQTQGTCLSRLNGLFVG